MINALLAVDQFGGMGFNGTMPWPRDSVDLANFKELTMGHVVVMGRKTWEDKNMPRPLPGRVTYVATHRHIPTNTITGDVKEKILKLEKQYPDKIIWIIGGPSLLEQCDGIIDRIYLTHHRGSYKIDTKINLKTFLTGWFPKTASADPNTKFTTVVYENIFKRTSGSLN
jgi:dihydrofolate reductase